MTLKTGSHVIKNIKLTVIVYPIHLPEMENSIYYEGYLKSHGSISNAYKTVEQYTAEQKDLVEHGVNDATVYAHINDTVLCQEMAIRQSEGMNNTNLYLFESDKLISNDPTLISHYKTILAPYGVKNIYYYGPDESVINRTQVTDEILSLIHI